MRMNALEDTGSIDYKMEAFGPRPSRTSVACCQHDGNDIKILKMMKYDFFLRNKLRNGRIEKKNRRPGSSNTTLNLESMPIPSQPTSDSSICKATLCTTSH